MARRFWTILTLWSLYGLFNTVVVHYRSALYGKPMGWAECAMYEISFAWAWAAVTPLILALGRRFPIGNERRNIAVHLLGAIAVAVLTKTLWDFTALPFIDLSQVPNTLASFQKSVLRALDFNFLHYVIVLLCLHAVDFYRKYEDGLLRASQLEAQLATAQLQALKMQLHPHFLFNTLHSISELVHSDPGRAEFMIVRLSHFLRLTLDHNGQQEIPVADEIEFLRRYLEIEQMRFEGRLTVKWEIDPAALPAPVPNLILQPLVENALKHGVSRNTSPGVVRISCMRRNGELTLSVHDNGPGAAPPLREGVGLSNTRARLERLYGPRAAIHLGRPPAGGFDVTLHIPIRQVSP